MPASPFVYGSGYDQIAQQQMGLDSATTNRMLASQAMLREVQRAAVAQRQQEIAAYQQAQAQADQQAQRDQENQYRLAALIQDYQNRNRSEARYKDETTYNRGQDVIGNLLRARQMEMSDARGKTADQLAREQFEFQKVQPSAAEIMDKRKAQETADMDRNDTQLSQSLAEEMNALAKYRGNVAGIQNVDTQKNDRWFDWIRPNAPFLNQLPQYLPPGADPSSLVGKNYTDALATIKLLNQQKLDQYQELVNAHAKQGGALVGTGPNGQVIPTFIPRIPLPSGPGPGPGPVQPSPVTPPGPAATDPGVQEVIRLMGTGLSRPEAIKIVSQIVRASSAGMGGGMRRAY